MFIDIPYIWHLTAGINWVAYSRLQNCVWLLYTDFTPLCSTQLFMPSCLLPAWGKKAEWSEVEWKSDLLADHICV